MRIFSLEMGLRGLRSPMAAESIGGFANISISHCQITNTKMSGIALYEVDAHPSAVLIDVAEVTPANFVAESSASQWGRQP